MSLLAPAAEMSPSLASVKCQSQAERPCMCVWVNQTYLWVRWHAGIDQSLSIRHQMSIKDGGGEERPSERALVSGQRSVFSLTWQQETDEERKTSLSHSSVLTFYIQYDNRTYTRNAKICLSLFYLFGHLSKKNISVLLQTTFLPSHQFPNLIFS